MRRHFISTKRIWNICLPWRLWSHTSENQPKGVLEYFEFFVYGKRSLIRILNSRCRRRGQSIDTLKLCVSCGVVTWQLYLDIELFQRVWLRYFKFNGQSYAQIDIIILLWLRINIFMGFPINISKWSQNLGRIFTKFKIFWRFLPK